VNTQPLTDERLDEVIAWMKSANPFAQYAWGWETGRFIDFRWSGNVVRAAAEPGFFEQHCTLVRRDGDLVALVIAEVGRDDHCVLTPAEDPETLEWGVKWLLERRQGQPLVLYPSDDATWIHQVLARHGFTKGEVAGLEWGYDLGDVPEPLSPGGWVIDFVRGPEDYGGVARCLEGAFGGKFDRVAALESLATNPMYVPELSVVARAPDGDIAAYCRGTVEGAKGLSSIDPVATHPDYQRRGLGAAVVLRCFAEQRQRGAAQSFIGSGPEGSAGTRLYRKLNPKSTTSHSEWFRPA
jgi:GNAT superfamily N-acetyltransferase